VDDTTTGTTDNDATKDPVPIKEKELTSDEEAMVKRMEDIIQFFLDLLQVTGDTINSFYVANNTVVIFDRAIFTRETGKEEGWNIKNRRIGLDRLVRSPFSNSLTRDQRTTWW
jgi:hypothetical protein